jgi:hypothetical protein
MPNSNPRDARTYNSMPTLWKYDPQTNILWLKLTDASNNTSGSQSTSRGSPSQSTTPAQPDCPIFASAAVKLAQIRRDRRL